MCVTHTYRERVFGLERPVNRTRSPQKAWGGGGGGGCAATERQQGGKETDRQTQIGRERQRQRDRERSGTESESARHRERQKRRETETEGIVVNISQRRIQLIQRLSEVHH